MDFLYNEYKQIPSHIKWKNKVQENVYYATLCENKEGMVSVNIYTFDECSLIYAEHL